MMGLRWWKWLCVAVLAAAFLIGVLVVHPSPAFEKYGDGNLAKIMFFHVPCAIVAWIGFVSAGVNSLRYLSGRDSQFDERALAAAEVGLLFGVLATVTGAFFSKSTWGAFWNWDPRQTSMLIVILIYGAYMALRSSIPDPERRARLAATYAILAMVVSTFLIFVLPRIPAVMDNSLHPRVVDRRGGMDSQYRMVFAASNAGFIMLYCWLVDVTRRARRAIAPREAGQA